MAALELARPGDVADSVRRLVRDQVTMALDDLGIGFHDDPDAAIHDCRKRCKKVRGLVRLVRPAIADGRYRACNDTARDAARELAPFRAAVARDETYATLLHAWPDGAPDDATHEIVGDLLGARRATVSVDLAIEHARLARARDLLRDLLGRVDDLELDASGWDAIEAGVATTYRRGRRAMRRARDERSSERFHEWRKRVKYTWYHLRLLRPTAPSVLTPTARSFHQLSDALGDAHDLGELSVWLRSDDPVVVRLPDPDAVLDRIDGTRRRLEQRALAVGARLYAEPPGSFTERLGRYWVAWCEHGDEPAVGDLAFVLGDG